MKEFDENEAIKAMSDVLPCDLRNEDALLEILDLIFDYYEENGDLEIDIEEFENEADSNEDIDGMVDFITRHIRKNSAAKDFPREAIVKAVQAEIDYELSLNS